MQADEHLDPTSQTNKHSGRFFGTSSWIMEHSHSAEKKSGHGKDAPHPYECTRRYTTLADPLLVVQWAKYAFRGVGGRATSKLTDGHELRCLCSEIWRRFWIRRGKVNGGTWYWVAQQSFVQKREVLRWRHQITPNTKVKRTTPFDLQSIRKLKHECEYGYPMLILAMTARITLTGSWIRTTTKSTKAHWL